MLDLARAKAHLKIEDDETDEDLTVAAELAAATRAIEDRTGRLLSERTVVEQVAASRVRADGIALFKGPVSAVSGVVYVDGSGGSQTLGSFRLVEGDRGVLLPEAGGAFPSVAARHPGAMTVTYQAGYLPDEAPAPIEQAVLLMLGYLHANRDVDAPMPRAIDGLIGPYCGPGIG